MPIFIERALKNEPIIVFGDGEQTRDFIFVKDIVAANFFFADTNGEDRRVQPCLRQENRVINHLAAYICRLTGSLSVIQRTAERSGDVKHSVAAIDKLRAAGSDSTIDFETGLRDTIKAFAKANQEVVQSVG